MEGFKGFFALEGISTLSKRQNDCELVFFYQEVLYSKYKIESLSKAIKLLAIFVVYPLFSYEKKNEKHFQNR